MNKKSEHGSKDSEVAAADPAGREAGVSEDGQRKNGGWQRVEELREKAELKASLADVWDEEFDLDEEILAELEHKEEYFTRQEDSEEEIFDEADEADEFFDDEEV